jgi:hypothetical protein
VFGLQARNVARDLVLVENLPYLRQKARQFAGELRPLLGGIGKVQQLLANQVIEGALHAETPLDSFRRLALLDPDLLESDGHSWSIYRRRTGMAIVAAKFSTNHTDRLRQKFD